MALDRERPEDVEHPDSELDAVESPADDPWARTDDEREHDFTNATQQALKDQDRNPRRLYGRATSDEARDSDPRQGEKPDATDETAEAERRVAELRIEGHGPQRHLDVSNDQLRARLGTPEVGQDGKPVLKPNGEVRSRDHIDPITGTTADGVHGRPHRGGDTATAFSNPSDLVAAEGYLRAKVTDNGGRQSEAAIAEVLGKDAEARMRGFRHDRSNSGEYTEVDFTGGTIKAFYKWTEKGAVQNVTLYPMPAPDREIEGDTDGQ